jgi:hypothetical protein
MQQMDITNNGLKLLLLAMENKNQVLHLELRVPTEVLLIVNLAIEVMTFKRK